MIYSEQSEILWRNLSNQNPYTVKLLDPNTTQLQDNSVGNAPINYTNFTNLMSPLPLKNLEKDSYNIPKEPSKFSSELKEADYSRYAIPIIIQSHNFNEKPKTISTTPTVSSSSLNSGSFSIIFRDFWNYFKSIVFQTTMPKVPNEQQQQYQFTSSEGQRMKNLYPNYGDSFMSTYAYTNNEIPSQQQFHTEPRHQIRETSYDYYPPYNREPQYDDFYTPYKTKG